MSCFSILPSTTKLPDFVGYQIHEHTTFTNTSTLDAFIASVQDSNEAYIRQFRSAFNCPNWNGKMQRFHLTFVQGALVFNAQAKSNCGPPTTPTPNRQICQSSCRLAASALSSIFAECSGTDRNSTRSNTIASYNQICTALPSTNDCIPAVKAEASQCGFSLALDFATYCAPSGTGSRTNDTCCRMPIVPTGTSSNPTTNNRTPTTTSLAIIIISSIAGATLLLVTILCCALRRRRKINNETQKEKDLQNQESFSDSQPMTVDPRFNFDFENESEPPSPVHESGPAVISRPPPVAYIQESLARGTIPVKPQQRRESLASWSAFSFSVDGSSNAKALENFNNNYANNANLNSNSNRPVNINTMNGTLRLPPPPLRSPSPSSIAVITAAAAALASEPSQKLKRKTFLFQKGNDSIMSPGLVPPPLPPAAPPRMPKNFLSLYSSSTSNSGSSRTDGNRTDSSINVQSREWNLDSVDTPGPGDIAIVLHEYETTLRDELALVPGDFVQVHAVYLDGWGHGNVGDQFGAFPLVCVKRLVLEGVDVESDNDQTDKQLRQSGFSEEEDNRRRRRQKKISMANVGGGGIFNEKEVNLRRSSLKLFL